MLYRSHMNPSLRRNFEAMDPLEWLARLADHIPDPGQHRTLFNGEYSSRVRGCGEPTEPAAEVAEEHRPRRRASPSWRRLIAKIYQVDPLLCNPEAEKPPPGVREMLRVAEHGDGWGVPQEWD